jgi:hypothetical protein
VAKQKRVAPTIPPDAAVAAFWQDYVRQANEMLAVARGDSARWWIYSISMRTFELVIGEATGKGGNILLITTGTQSIAGPTDWSMQALEVFFLGMDAAVHYEIRDDAVGFRVAAESFRWELDVDLLNRVGEVGFR